MVEGECISYPNLQLTVDAPRPGLIEVSGQIQLGVFYETVPVTRTFTVTEPGTYSFNANGYGTSSARYFYGRLNATFFPTS